MINVRQVSKCERERERERERKCEIDYPHESKFWKHRNKTTTNQNHCSEREHNFAIWSLFLLNPFQIHHLTYFVYLFFISGFYNFLLSPNSTQLNSSKVKARTYRLDSKLVLAPKNVHHFDCFNNENSVLYGCCFFRCVFFFFYYVFLFFSTYLWLPENDIILCEAKQESQVFKYRRVCFFCFLFLFLVPSILVFLLSYFVVCYLCSIFLHHNIKFRVFSFSVSFLCFFSLFIVIVFFLFPLSSFQRFLPFLALFLSFCCMLLLSFLQHESHFSSLSSLPS